MKQQHFAYPYLEFSGAVYENNQNERTKKLSGFTELKFDPKVGGWTKEMALLISEDANQPGVIYIACRGSKNAWNFCITDFCLGLNSLTFNWFSEYLLKPVITIIDSVTQEVDKLLENKPISKVYFTGHSLGGLIAFSCAAIFMHKNKNIPVECVSFESPAVSDVLLDLLAHHITDKNFIIPENFINYISFPDIVNTVIPQIGHKRNKTKVYHLEIERTNTRWTTLYFLALCTYSGWARYNMWNKFFSNYYLGNFDKYLDSFNKALNSFSEYIQPYNLLKRVLQAKPVGGQEEALPELMPAFSHLLNSDICENQEGLRANWRLIAMDILPISLATWATQIYYTLTQHPMEGISNAIEKKRIRGEVESWPSFWQHNFFNRILWALYDFIPLQRYNYGLSTFFNFWTHGKKEHDLMSEQSENMLGFKLKKIDFNLSR